VSADRPLRVGVIGLGFGAVHARVLNELDGAELAAVCDLDGRRLAVATRGRTARGYTEYEALLREERLDAVVVALPTRLHEEAALAAIRRGVHLLVEKPLAPSLAEGRLLIEAAAKAGVRLMAGHIERFNPAVVELRRRLAAGEAGRVLQATARRLGPFAARVRDVSVVHDLAIHDIDVLRSLLGAEVERVYAETRAGVRTPFADSLSAILRFAAEGVSPGPPAVLEVDWLSPRKVREVAVLGDRGLFVADLLAKTLDFYQVASEESETGVVAAAARVPVQPQETLKLELAAWLDALRSGAPLPVSDRDALAALAIADALEESGASGRPVSPEPV
jgi:predicted dehydrogenase